MVKRRKKIDRGVGVKVEGLKLITCRQLKLFVGGMELCLYVDQHAGDLTIMLANPFGSHLVIAPEVSSVIRVGMTQR